jgi:catechol 2,3-dioxygenase-like lactoylglutathione lyase family enzyme
MTLWKDLYMTTIPDIQMVTVSVADVNRSLGFYRDLLGFKVISQEVFIQGSTAYLLDIGNGHVLRLVYADMPAKPTEWSLDDLQTGLRHMAFKVNNVDQMAAHLKQANVEFTLDPLDAVGGVRIAFFKDPDGALVEIVQNELQYHVEGPAYGMLPPLKPQGDALLFDHVAITVADLDKALAFYTALLGFGVIGQLLFKDERGFTITYLKAGSAVLELFSYAVPTKPNPYNRDLAVRGFKHVTYKTQDVGKMVQNLSAAGITLPHRPGDGQVVNAAVFIGPDGVPLELVAAG